VQRKKFIHLTQRAQTATAIRQSSATPPFPNSLHSIHQAIRAHFAHKWSQFKLRVPCKLIRLDTDMDADTHIVTVLVFMYLYLGFSLSVHTFGIRLAKMDTSQLKCTFITFIFPLGLALRKFTALNVSKCKCKCKYIRE